MVVTWGLSCGNSQIVAVAGAIWRLDWTGYGDSEMWRCALIHNHSHRLTDSWCWHVPRHSAGALNHSAYTCPLHMMMAAGFWKWHSKSQPSKRIRRSCKASAPSNRALKLHSIICTAFYWLELAQVPECECWEAWLTEAHLWWPATTEMMFIADGKRKISIYQVPILYRVLQKYHPKVLTVTHKEVFLLPTLEKRQLNSERLHGCSMS